MTPTLAATIITVVARLTPLAALALRLRYEHKNLELRITNSGASDAKA